MRLEEKFKQLKKQGRKAFIAYIPFGFPHPKLTKPICLALEQAGVDIIELGLPFSDPLADGEIIQRASSLALAKGANTKTFLAALKPLAKVLKIPLVAMTYCNPVFNFGLCRFLQRIKQSGVSSAIIVDLPIEEAKDYLKECRQLSIDPVFFITPTTSGERIKKIARISRGFIYYISVTGITGPKSFNYPLLAKQLKNIKRLTKLPVCVGFGIHSLNQVKKLNKLSDGVIVGSSLVKFIEKNSSKKNFLKQLKIYTKSLIPSAEICMS